MKSKFYFHYWNLFWTGNCQSNPGIHSILTAFWYEKTSLHWFQEWLWGYHMNHIIAMVTGNFKMSLMTLICLFLFIKGMFSRKFEILYGSLNCKLTVLKGDLYCHSMDNIKGILPDFIQRVLSKIPKFQYFLHLFVALLQEAHFPKEIKGLQLHAFSP